MLKQFIIGIFSSAVAHRIFPPPRTDGKSHSGSCILRLISLIIVIGLLCWMLGYGLFVAPNYILLTLYAGLKFLATNAFIGLDKLFYPGFDAPSILTWGLWGLIGGSAIQGCREMRRNGRKGQGLLAAFIPLLLLVLTGGIKNISIPNDSNLKPIPKEQQTTTRSAQKTINTTKPAQGPTLPQGRTRMAILTFEDKSGKARRYGALDQIIIDKIISAVLNDSSATEFLEVISPDQLEQVMSEQNLGFAGRFDEKTVAGIGKVAGVHELVIGQITAIIYMPPRPKQRNWTSQATIRVKTGTERYVDKNGKTQTRDKYSNRQISANVTHHQVESSVKIVGSYRIIDVKTATLKRLKNFDKLHEFKADWARFSGDIRALSKTDQALTSKKEVHPPVEVQMALDAAKILAGEIADSLKAYAGSEKKPIKTRSTTKPTTKRRETVQSTSQQKTTIQPPTKHGPIRLPTKKQETVPTPPVVQKPSIPSVPSAPIGMVLIPSGEFQMGSSESDDEKPVHVVYTDAFYMDKYEVTNAQYKAFLQANPQWQKDRISSKYHDGDYLKHWNGNNYPNGKANHPVTFVSWYAAMAYAKWTGKRLPTEAEWEKAARGAFVGKKYPWGNSIGSTRANYDKKIGDTTFVGKYSTNGYGLYDMAGNVMEWCLDGYDENFYGTTSRQNPIAGGNIKGITGNFLNSTATRVLRGGSWSVLAQNMRVADRTKGNPTLSYFGVGFRCVRERLNLR